MSSLLQKLKAGVNNVFPTVWPGTEEKIGLRILTEQEVQDAHFAAEALFKKHGIDYSAATYDAYQSEQNTQILSRALVDPAPSTGSGQAPKPVFKNADELRGLIAHPDIKAALVNEYNAWQAECSPALEAMTEEQYEALFDQVKKNGPLTLSGSSLSTLAGLITYLADRQTKLQTVSGSASS